MNRQQPPSSNLPGIRPIRSSAVGSKRKDLANIETLAVCHGIHIKLGFQNPFSRSRPWQAEKVAALLGRAGHVDRAADNYQKTTVGRTATVDKATDNGTRQIAFAAKFVSQEQGSVFGMVGAPLVIADHARRKVVQTRRGQPQPESMNLRLSAL